MVNKKPSPPARSRTPKGVTSGPGSGSSTRPGGHYVGTTGKATNYTPAVRMRDAGAGVGTPPKKKSRAEVDALLSKGGYRRVSSTQQKRK